MKVLTNTSQNNRVVDTFEDSVVITITAENVTVDDGTFLDLNSSNAAAHENATLPEDFVPHKYVYDGATWTIRTDWVEPE